MRKEASLDDFFHLLGKMYFHSGFITPYPVSHRNIWVYTIFCPTTVLWVWIRLTSHSLVLFLAGGLEIRYIDLLLKIDLISMGLEIKQHLFSLHQTQFVYVSSQGPLFVTDFVNHVYRQQLSSTKDLHIRFRIVEYFYSQLMVNWSVCRLCRGGCKDLGVMCLC